MKKYTKEEAEHIVQELLTRGVGTFVDPGDTFRKKLIAKALGEYQKPIHIKFGVDPTKPDIHLGHAVVLRKLRQMQDLGCHVIFLIGDYTAQIGDPTGKNKTRPDIEQSAVEENMHTYLAQVGKILRTDTEVFSWIRNSDWFVSPTDILLPDDAVVEFHQDQTHLRLPPQSLMGKMAAYQETRMQAKKGSGVVHTVSLTNLLWVIKHITLAQLSERDMFQKRIHEGESLHMHEMLYPVIQGIDSDVLARIYGSCDLEVGGTDQTFNLLMGRRVMEMNKREPQAVLSFELLVGLDGKEKMSKSLDNYISIIDTPTEMFGKVMSLSDEMMPIYYTLCTFTPIEEIGRIEKRIQAGELHPKQAKQELAQQITEMYYGQEDARKARENFDATFQKGGVPEEMTTVSCRSGSVLVDVLLAHHIVESKTEYRRLLEAGAVKRNGEEKIIDPFLTVTEMLIVKVGKHRFVKIVIE